MVQVTSTRNENFCEVLALINHVFGKENSTVKMDDIFTDLLCRDNMEHMRIIKADGKPVSVINYVINDVDINGCVIKAANIGAVCTHEDYRHRGYSSLILKDCLDKMRNEGVDFLYVSGEIGLYTKNNIHITGKMHSFNIENNYLTGHKELHNGKYEVKECSHEDISLLYTLYDSEAVKYIRDKQRFCDLAGRVPGASVFNHAARLFQVEEKGQIQGYFICAIIPEKNGGFKMEVIEFAGKREAVVAGIMKTMVQLSPASISGSVPWFDRGMLKVLKDYEMKTEACNYPGTMRIINFTQFMRKLKPLYAQEKRLESIEFCESDGHYIIMLGSMELAIEDSKAMHDLFLDNNMELLKKEHITGDDTLLDMLKLILPIPVPYPYNLNYI
ncbi:MAG TPA: GNAT family N-acetyltransferase [Clostridia bacterium]|nr:GNAT family N-acetyltransferase [Clostridia bacterium]